LERILFLQNHCNMRIYIFSILLHLTTVVFGQTKINLSDGFNVVKDFEKEYKDVEKQVGEAKKIIKDDIEQMFCGMTRGRNIHFIYEKYGIKISTWKRLGYQSKKEIGKGKGYYKNCRLSEVFISGNSNLKINNSAISEFADSTIEKTLGKAMRNDTVRIYHWKDTSMFSEANEKILPKTPASLKTFIYQDNSSKSYFSFYFLLTGQLLYIEVKAIDYGG